MSDSDWAARTERLGVALGARLEPGGLVWLGGRFSRTAGAGALRLGVPRSDSECRTPTRSAARTPTRSGAWRRQAGNLLRQRGPGLDRAARTHGGGGGGGGGARRPACSNPPEAVG